MLDRPAHMRVALDAEPSHEPDTGVIWFAKCVRWAATDRQYYPTHQPTLLSRDALLPTTPHRAAS
jgi:hypothetical protein